MRTTLDIAPTKREGFSNTYFYLFIYLFYLTYIKVSHIYTDGIL